MLQRKFVVNIFIHPGRITVSESFYIVRYQITENIRKDFMNEFHLGVGFVTIKCVFPIKWFDSQVYGINILAFL